MNLRTYFSQNRTTEFVLILSAAIVGFWIWGAFSADGLIDDAIEFLKHNARENVAIAIGVFGGLAVLSALISPFSSAPLVPFAIIVWGNWITFWILFVGWMAGELASYAIGRYVGSPVVSRIVSAERVEAWREVISRRVTFFMALLFRIATPAETGYVFGLVRYHFGAYVVITFIAEAPIAALMVWASDALVAQDFISFAGIAAGAVFISVAAVYLLRERMRQ